MDIKDLTGLGEPLSKLVESIRAGIGIVIEPHQIRRVAKAKADELRLLESAKLECVIEAAKSFASLDVDTLALVPGISTDLIARARQRVAMQELSRQNNLDAIVAEAIEALPSQVNADPVDTTWMKRFFTIVADVDDKQMHGLWGKILAGETTAPGRFSLRTLEIFRNVSKREAEVFVEACHLAMGVNKFVLLIPTRPSFFDADIDLEAMQKFEFNFNNRMILADVGLVFLDVLSMPIPTSAFSYNNNGRWLDFSVEPRPSEEVMTAQTKKLKSMDSKIPPDHLSIVKFTEAGRAIGELVANEFNHAYFELLSTRYKEWGINIALRPI